MDDLQKYVYVQEQVGLKALSCHIQSMVFLHGSRLCRPLSELLAVHAQLPLGQGGLGSNVVFLDGGNNFDLYFVTSIAKAWNLNPHDVLRKIWISRAFTCYQLLSLIFEKLPEALNRFHSRLVVVSNLPELFCDPDVPRNEALGSFNVAMAFLSELAWKRNILLLVSSPRPSDSWHRASLESLIRSRSSLVVKVEEKASGLAIWAETPRPLSPVSVPVAPPKPEQSLEAFLGRPHL